ncbi:MAG TPA: PfkB family carbohydrate kinase [Candidatus Methylomirabilis sp.]|nr:PfkB family carbohydrate kinase [Candidatus Methylomirabilis sp.]HSC71946.1 PfkB family carbohydrate kinase [Candidatus Methylomirabilis sp.]
MSILVVGSVAFDTVKTPFGHVSDVLGGSATYFSTAASFFAEVRLVAVVGEDFPEHHLEFLRSRRVDLDGLQRVPGRTFRWKGEYGFALNEARTLDTQLNVFATFAPKIPEAYRDSKIVFLANIDPDLQREVLRQVRRPALVAADTMNYWIAGKPGPLRETLGLVDILIINDAETRQLAEEANLVLAARKIQAWGPRVLVIKRGEYGALMVNRHDWFAAPALPLEGVQDPTGAGDCFAGGFVGYLAKGMSFDGASLRKAVIMGSVMASFNVEAFSLDRLRSLTDAEIDARYRAFRQLAHFEDL